jgi:pimeloyl-ACP methyl ester carboxylesterase
VLLAIALFAALKPEIVKPQIVKPNIVKAENEPSPSGDRLDQSAVARAESIPGPSCPARQPLIVVGFMGGHVRSDNLVHGEARLARDLDDHYPGRVDARTFENRREHEALGTVLKLLDTSKDGRLSEAEKSSARIVIFGHSWGASETVHFARELNRRGIPVLLTVQVDSVQKSGQDDQNKACCMAGLLFGPWTPAAPPSWAVMSPVTGSTRFPAQAMAGLPAHSCASTLKLRMTAPCGTGLKR